LAFWKVLRKNATQDPSNGAASRWMTNRQPTHWLL
jgi:hypothetical protein